MSRPVLIVGSGNEHKIEEIRSILADLDVEVHGASILGSVPEVEETGSTFEENAEIKALAFARAAAPLLATELSGRRVWVLSDDSGLCVDALGGAPGVRSARYAGPSDGAGASQTERNNAKLLDALADVPESDRAARFVCCIVLVAVRADAAPHVLARVRGECEGRIVSNRRGAGGFGYDPLFFVPSAGRTFAELPPDEKNRMSHRGRALDALCKGLAELIEDSSGADSSGDES